jgi:hypothetical protein
MINCTRVHIFIIAQGSAGNVVLRCNFNFAVNVRIYRGNLKKAAKVLKENIATVIK